MELDGWMSEWMDGQTDGRMGGKMDEVAWHKFSITGW